MRLRLQHHTESKKYVSCPVWYGSLVRNTEPGAKRLAEDECSWLSRFAPDAHFIDGSV